MLAGASIWGVGNNAVSIASGASIVIVEGDVSGDDGAEGIHLRFYEERLLGRIGWRKVYQYL
jgi:hypothetical protein